MAGDRGTIQRAAKASSVVKRRRITIASAKAKGRSLQQWVCKQISAALGLPWGRDEMIAPREGAQSGTDVRLVGQARELFPFSVECKNQEKWEIPKWISLAQKNQQEGTDWLLVVKKNRVKPIIIMDAERFFTWWGELRRQRRETST